MGQETATWEWEERRRPLNFPDSAVFYSPDARLRLELGRSVSSEKDVVLLVLSVCPWSDAGCSSHARRPRAPLPARGPGR